MDIWQLGIFCRVIELGGFSRASRAVNLTQPTVSSHIKELEQYFGCRLIDRLAGGAVPTPAGELLYDHARRLIGLRDEMETAMAEFQGKIRGRLKIGGSTIPGGYILPGLIGAFKQQYPGVSVVLKVGDTGSVIAKVAAGEIELGVVGARTRQAGIAQRELIRDRMQVIVPGHHRWKNRKAVKLSALRDEAFILREEGSGTRKSIALEMTARGCRLEDLDVVAEMGSTEAVIQAIKGGLGISILSPIAVAEELQIGTLKALNVTDADFTRHFYLTTHRRRTRSPMATAFIAHLSI
jgi:DNA-binding transcriptional LysR family regulator